MANSVAAAPSEEKLGKPNLYRTLIATCIGNGLEWFDITIYVFFASYIGHAFFPSEDVSNSLLITFASFGMSFMIRPLGAIVLGAYADRAGRKASLLVSISLMMLGSLMIAVMPGYAVIGMAAPVLIVLARLIQGFSAGGEFGSSTAFLVEHFPERKAFIASWQFATQGASTLLAAGFGMGLASALSEQDIQDWGWRIPFFFGLLIGPVGLYIRRHIDESPGFHQGLQDEQPLKNIFLRQKTWFFTAIGLMMVSTAINYVISYIPTYATQTLKLPSLDAYTSTFVGGVILTVVTPLAGLWAEKIGRMTLMKWSVLLVVLTTYPGFYLLGQQLSQTSLIFLVMWLALLKALYFSVIPSVMADLFPPASRATGIALSYNIAVTLFGGFAPLICIWLIKSTGDDLAPAYYLVVLGIFSLAAVYQARRSIEQKKTGAGVGLE
ncbi:MULTISPECIES: MFS transporter [Chromobacterium]|nr:MULTISPECIES: MFS transporter [Chromobacterium]QOZ85523.1 MFS transporter [Chromobacterium sp. Rain0013]WON85754.1 MFS transporter [Chromobacterium haemolyticum]